MRRQLRGGSSNNKRGMTWVLVVGAQALVAALVLIGRASNPTLTARATRLAGDYGPAGSTYDWLNEREVVFWPAGTRALFRVDTVTGARREITAFGRALDAPGLRSRTFEGGALSPDGRWLLWCEDPQIPGATLKGVFWFATPVTATIAAAPGAASTGVRGLDGTTVRWPMSRASTQSGWWPSNAWLPDSSGWVEVEPTTDDRKKGKNVLPALRVRRYGLDGAVCADALVPPEFVAPAPGVRFDTVAAAPGPDRIVALASGGDDDGTVHLLDFGTSAVAASGSRPPRLITVPSIAPDSSVREVSVSPNGKRVACLYAVARPASPWRGWLHRIAPFYPAEAPPNTELWITRLDTGERQRVGRQPARGGKGDDDNSPGELVWARDNQRLTFLFDGRLYAVSARP